MARKASRRTLGKGRWLRLVQQDGWEFVERTNVTGIVVIVAVTPKRELLLVEQFRPPVGATVVELPAGLAGDEPDADDETMIDAAKRELHEETGYEAKHWEVLAAGPPSAGQSTEVVTFVGAEGLKRTGKGGGVADENITTHLVPLRTVRRWLKRRADEGALIDAKLWGGLYFAIRR